MPNRLPRAFYLRHTATVARALIGQRLVRVLDDGRRLAGVIVETEAYLGSDDMAAHTRRGLRSRRNASMWGIGGTAYVYFTYGMHHCFNVVTGPAAQGTAVLIRALAPEEGIDTMRAHRPRSRGDFDLCRGPARLCRALAIDRSLDGSDLVEGEALFIEQLRRRALPARRIGSSPRIGVAYAGTWAEQPLRYFDRHSPCISGPARLNQPR